MQQLLTFETLVELGYVANRSTLNRRIKRGEFPPPITVGTRNVAWLKTEIDEWTARSVAKRDEKIAKRRHAA